VITTKPARAATDSTRSPAAANSRIASRSLQTCAVALGVALVLLPFIVKLNGTPHADWLQFAGRLHPLAVHIPIGLIVLLPILELLGARRSALRESASFVLALAAITALGTLALGYMLAFGAGDAGATVTRHLWGGIVLTIGLISCVFARPLWLARKFRPLYPALLTCVLFALTWTAHQGGSLTHGGDYLTRYMPTPLRRILPARAGTGASPDSFYALQINPIFDANCVACHGSGKMQGGLRLDSYDQLMRGGKDGPVIAPNHPDHSTLLVRVTLPTTEKQFMPAEGHTPLSANQIAMIRAWIANGASPTATQIAGFALPELPRPAAPQLQPVPDYTALLPEIRQMQQAQGAKLIPLSAKLSDGLILNTVDAPANFGDAQLAAFLKFAPYIVEANLARTAVTDASFDTLSHFTHLRALHLEGTAVTGNGMAKLVPLTQLTYLNLNETKVTPQSITPIRSMPNLHHLYLFNTAADIPTQNSASQTP
jgi:uncharacterized membrane protein/mono/diheme cytochrome c family protein